MDWLIWALALDQDGGFTWAGCYALWEMYGREWIAWCWHGGHDPERPGTADH